jgi:hypothetical protein
VLLAVLWASLDVVWTVAGMRVSSSHLVRGGNEAALAALEDAMEFEEERHRLGGHEICEDRGLELPTSLYNELARALTAEEEKASFTNAGLLPAIEVQQQPKAIWVLGPSAAGKSHIVGVLDDDANFTRPIYVDGDYFRNVHQGYQAAVWNGHHQETDGKRDPCIWKAAWETVKPFRGPWRTKLWESALEAKRNIYVIDVCSNYRTCISKMERLKGAGYTNDVWAVVVTESQSNRRGSNRAVLTGKRFGPTFSLSMSALIPLIETSNGNYKIINNCAEMSLAEQKRSRKLKTWKPLVVKQGSGFSASHYPSRSNHLTSDQSGSKDELNIRASVSEFVSEIESHRTGTPHLPYCEDMGDALDRDTLLHTTLPEHELKQAEGMTNLAKATTQEKPVALWILGPPGVGKSFMLKSDTFLRDDFRFEHLPGTSDWDAVILDGEVYREVSGSFQTIVDRGLKRSPPCVWRYAWDGSEAKKAI